MLELHGYGVIVAALSSGPNNNNRFIDVGSSKVFNNGYNLTNKLIVHRKIRKPHLSNAQLVDRQYTAYDVGNHYLHSDSVTSKFAILIHGDMGLDATGTVISSKETIDPTK